jgi:hypothetical protein
MAPDCPRHYFGPLAFLFAFEDFFIASKIGELALSTALFGCGWYTDA